MRAAMEGWPGVKANRYYLSGDRKKISSVDFIQHQPISGI